MSPCPKRVPTVSQDTGKVPQSDRVPVSPPIGHGTRDTGIEHQKSSSDSPSVSPCATCGKSTAAKPAICPACWSERVKHRKAKNAARWIALSRRKDTMTKPTLRAWLRAQHHRDDPVGDLAREVADDPLVPLDQSAVALLDRLASVGASEDAQRACRAAVREWEAS